MDEIYYERDNASIQIKKDESIVIEAPVIEISPEPCFIFFGNG